MQDLEDRHPPLEAAGVAVPAAAVVMPEHGGRAFRGQPENVFFLERRSVFDLAMTAQRAHQPLGDDPDDVAGDDVGQDADVEQSRKCTQRRIGVQRGEHLVTGHRRPECHLGGLAVAHFAHQDDVRVLAHDGTDAVGEIELDRVAHRGLPDQRDRILDRIFEGHDVDPFDVYLRQQRVERRGLAAAGRAGDHEDALGPRQHQVELRQHRFGQAHLIQADDRLLAVEDAQDDVLAVDGRMARHPEIDRPAGQVERDAAVLRRAGLGDVHAAHDLEAHGNAGPVVLVQASYLLEDAVDAVANAQEGELGLEVDVRGAALHGVDHQCIDQPHDRLGVFIAAGLETLPVELAGLDLPQDAVDRQLEAVELIDEVLELGFPGEHGAQLHVRWQRGAQLVHRHHVEHLGGGDCEHALVGLEGDRQHPLAPGEFLRHELERVGVDHDLREVDGLLADSARHEIADHRLGDESQTHQQPPDRHALRFLLGERDAQLVGRDQSLLHQQLAEPHLAARRVRYRRLGRWCDGDGHVVHSTASDSWPMRAITCFWSNPPPPRANDRSSALR